MGSRFVRPETTILSLSNGDTLTVKRELTAGDTRARNKRSSFIDEAGEVKLDRWLHGVATITAYLLDWSFTDDHGRPVPIRGLDAVSLEAVLDGLDTDSYVEILRAIETHEAAVDTEKKSGPGIAISS